MPLENDPRNECVGCGPANSLGLQLQFERVPQGAATSLLVKREHQGSPERLHSALLYLAMTETANWSVYADLDRIGLPVKTSALELLRWIKVGETLAVRGAWRATERAVDVEAHDEKGALVAKLRREYALPTRREFMERLGYETLPAALEGMLPE